MNIIQSFWSKPALKNRWGYNNQLEVNKWLCAASCLLAQRNGATVTMYTDRIGAVLLKDIPYDKMKIVLDDSLEDTPIFFWAAGKFIALEDAPLGSIHIDNDVLLMERKTVEALRFAEYDLIVQQEEPIDTEETQKFYAPHREGVKILGYPSMMNPDYPQAYNVGIIGFSNEELRSKYIYNYHLMLEHCKQPKMKDIVSSLCLYKTLSLDLIMEQIVLHDFAQGYRVKELLDRNNLIRDVEKLNYKHLLGGVKYSMLPQIQELVKQLNINLYNKLL